MICRFALLVFSLLLAVFPSVNLADEAVMPPRETAPLRVMTFNIRFNNPSDGPNAWAARRDWVAEIIRDQRVDLVGMQEALPGQIADLKERLPDYGWYGVGRDDGKRGGEHTPIFYRQERLALLDQGAFWLSEQPDQPGSKSWDTSLPRVTVWTKFQDHRDGSILFAFNTHFDHQGDEARHESAKLLMRKIPKIAGDAATLLTGDFNCLPDSAPYRTIALSRDAAGEFTLRDARIVSQSKPQGPDATWNGFRRIVPGRIIDFIFVTPNLRVVSHTTIEETRNGRFPSDHLPILVELGD